MIGLSSWTTAFVVVLGSIYLLYPLAVKIRRRNQSSRPDGIQVITDPANAKFEIVAVHGLGAHPEHTWICRTNKHQTGTQQTVHLLRDLLCKSFPEAKILSFAHNSDWFIDAPIKTAQQIGERLLSQLQDHRTGQRLPICFLGHSFGGIIIKEALCQSNDADQITQDTSGILFLGTPHQGSSFSIFGTILANLTRFLGSDIGLLVPLQQDSSQLRDLWNRFAKFCERRKEAKIRSFFETKPSYILGISIGQIVNENSARGPAGRAQPIEADHSGLNKYGGLQDTEYNKIIHAITDMRSVPLLDRADRHVLDSYTQEHLKIERLSGARLPMEQCYINLALLQSAESDQQQDALQPDAFHHSLLARLNIKEPDENNNFDLSTLFEPRIIRQEKEERRPRRILIRGRPGVGKTTLCKKIVHEFAHSRLWNKQFARLLWIPLRRLAGRRGSYTLRNLLHDEYFAQHGDSVSMLEELFQQCNKSDDTTSLFLLDGLDEIWYSLTHESDLYRFVQHLLNRPNVIVTSRPSVRVSGDIGAFDMELETIGFYPTQVHQYVHNMEPEHANNIVHFLEERPLIADLVRIPVQLDALCFSWRDKSVTQVTEHFGMTELYRAIERGIWKKDAVALGKIQDQDAPYWTELKYHMEAEMILLEKLAFAGMNNELTVFDAKAIGNLSGYLQSPRAKIDPTLRKLSFLRSSDASPIDASREYYFIHLTLQEYFTARYIKRQWVKGDKGILEIQDLDTGKWQVMSPTAFVRLHKYDEAFDVVWRFLAGILGSDAELQMEFFEIIQSEPLDVLGPTHQRLIMRCLFETRSSFSLRPALEGQLWSWLNFENGFKEDHFQESQSSLALATEMEFPLNDFVRHASRDRQFGSRVLQSINPRRTVDIEIMNAAIAWLKNAEDTKVVCATLLFFTNRSNSVLPTESGQSLVLQAIASRLEDKNCFVREAAANALKNQAHLSETVLQAIESRLEDEDSSVRKAAIRALKNQAYLSEGILQAIAGRLEHKDRFAREAAAKALEGQANLSEVVLQVIANGLKHENHMIRRTAAEALKGQATLSKAMLQAIAKGLEDENCFVREAAANALKKQAHLSETILQVIVDRLEDEDSRVREAAAETLEKQANLSHGMLEAIANRLEHETPSVQRAAIEVLGRQANIPEAVLHRIVDKLENEDFVVRGTAINTLVEQANLSDAILQAIANRLEHETPSVQRAAVDALGGQAHLSEGMLEAIANRLEHEIPSVQRAAIKVLRRQANIPEAVLHRIVDKLEDEYFHVREAAADILGRQAHLSEDMLQAIVDRLEDEDFYVREAAADALGRQAHLSEGMLQAIVDRLEDEDFYVREAAAEALERQAKLPDAVLQAIANSLAHEDRSIQEAVAEALGGQAKLSEVVLQATANSDNHENNSIRDAVLRAIANRLDDEDLSRRQAAVRALKKQANLSETVLQAIVDRLEDKNPSVREAAAEALVGQANLSEVILQAVANGLEDGDVEVRRTTAKTFRSQTNLSDVVMQAIVDGLEDRDLIVRHIASEALERQAPLSDVTLQAIANRLEHEDFSVRWVAIRIIGKQVKISETVLQAIVYRLEHKTCFVREAAAYALKTQGNMSETVLQAIVRRLEDEEFDVREAAAKALERQAKLPKTVLQAIANIWQRAKSSDPTAHFRDLLSIVKHNPVLIAISQSTHTFDTLFHFLLQQSFDQHVALYFYKDKICLNIGGSAVKHEGRLSTTTTDSARTARYVPEVVMKNGNMQDW